MAAKPIKLGLTLIGQNSVPEMVQEARRAEAIGFDVILLPDHLGLTAPLVPLVAIADAATTVKVSNLVINGAFYRPALLARDLAAVDSASGGRLIISLGTGYVEQEFFAAGLPFPNPAQRVRTLTEHVTEIRRLLSDPDRHPATGTNPTTDHGRRRRRQSVDDGGSAGRHRGHCLHGHRRRSSRTSRLFLLSSEPVTASKISS